MVSVMCNAYNHEAYIRDALDGFVMQKTNFRFEVLVHDDASTDGTADIIREYEKKYPELIKPIYQTENQRSKGGGRVGKIQRARVRGKYTAICEGDDYWTDPLKLQKQYDAMEAHPEVDMCAHAAKMVKAETRKLVRMLAPKDYDTILTAEEVIAGGGGYVATCSLFYRSELDTDIPRFRQKSNMDYYLQIHGSLRGGIIYFSDCMSEYRVSANGSWTMRIKKNEDKMLKYVNGSCRRLETLNEDTDYKYDKAIKKSIARNEFLRLSVQDQYKELRRGKYREIYLEQERKERIKIILKQYFMFLVRIKRRIGNG